MLMSCPCVFYWWSCREWWCYCAVCICSWLYCLLSILMVYCILFYVFNQMCMLCVCVSSARHHASHLCRFTFRTENFRCLQCFVGYQQQDNRPISPSLSQPTLRPKSPCSIPAGLSFRRLNRYLEKGFHSFHWRIRKVGGVKLGASTRMRKMRSRVDRSNVGCVETGIVKGS